MPNGRLPAESPDTEPSHLVLPVCGHLLRSIYVTSVLNDRDPDSTFLVINLVDDPEVAAAGAVGTLQVESEWLTNPAGIVQQATMDEPHTCSHDLLRKSIE